VIGDLVKRHNNLLGDPLTVQYVSDGTVGGTIQLSAYFGGGLGLDEPKGYKEQFVLSFTAVAPWWDAIVEGTASLNNSSLVTFNNIAKRTFKANWDPLDTGLSDTIDYVTHSPDGSTIFTGSRGTAAGTLLVRRIGAYATGWSEVGNGVDGNVYEIKFKPGTNQLWQCGAFGTANVGASGTAVNGIAYYDFDTSTWGGISSGGTIGLPSSTPQSFDWDAEENLIMGGDINVGSFHNVIVYDTTGGTYTYLTEGKAGDIGDGTAVWGLDNHVYKVKRIDSDIYSSNGLARTYIAGAGTAWEDQSGSASTASYTSPTIWRDYGHDFARGFKNSAGVAVCTIYAIEEHPNGDVWFGGNQDNEASGAVGIKDIYRIGAFDGTRFENLNVGLTDEAVYDIKYAPFISSMIAVGTFTRAGGNINVDKIGIHDGGVWKPESIDFSSVTGRSVSVYGSEIVYGFTGTVNTYISESTINYIGSAPGYPIFEFTGPGTLNYIYNETTDELVQFSGLVLYTGETITVDMTPDMKTVESSFRTGNMERYLVDGGDINVFHFARGNNTIKCNHGTALTLRQVRYTNRYTSISDIY